MCCLCKTLLIVTAPSPSPLSKLNPHHPFLIFFSSSSTSPYHHPPSLSSNNNSSSLSPPQTTPYILMQRQQNNNSGGKGFLPRLASSPSLSLNILTTCVSFSNSLFQYLPGSEYSDTTCKSYSNIRAPYPVNYCLPPYAECIFSHPINTISCGERISLIQLVNDQIDHYHCPCIPH